MTYSSIEFAFDRGRAALAALSRKGEVTAHDICDLREILGEGALSRDEANLLFAIERAPNSSIANGRYELWTLCVV